MKIKRAIIIFFLSLTVSAQYDANRLQSLYEYTDKALMLVDQLKAEAAIGRYLPYDTKAKIRLQKNIKRFETYLDSILLNMPDENKYRKLFLKTKEKWELYKGLINKHKITEGDWKQIVKLHKSIKNNLFSIKEILLLLLSPPQDALNAIVKLRELNEKVSTAFFSAVMKKIYEEPPVPVEDETGMIEDASKKIKKVQSLFDKDEKITFVINTMKSDLNTFHLGFKNAYDPQVLVSTYEKFNDKVFKIQREIFKTNRFY